MMAKITSKVVTVLLLFVTIEYILFPVQAAPPVITVITPNGGEVLRSNSEYNITWTVSDADNDLGTNAINISYSLNSGSWPWFSVANNVNTLQGFYIWNVPDFGVDFTNVRIRITVYDVAGNTAQDISDNDFSIDSSTPVVTLLSPNGGEVLKGGDTFTIVWTPAQDANLAPNPINLSYSLNGTFGPWIPIATGLSNNGSFVWNVPQFSVDYSSVRVNVSAYDLAGHEGFDISNANFSIDSTAPFIKVMQPDGGEILLGGATYEIRWIANDTHFAQNSINISYSTSGATGPWSTIATNLANSGSYNWTVPSITSTTVRVNITARDTVTHTGYDISDNDFSIVKAPIVRVVTPNGGEIFRGGDTITISWSVTGSNIAPNGVNISYSLNSSNGPWINIATNLSSSQNSYPWSAPYNESSSVRVRVTVYDVYGYYGEDSSDNDFIIDSFAPVVTVIAPNGGEIYPEKSTQPIRWNITDAALKSNSISIYYTNNSSAPQWKLIASSLPNSGIYNWTVPEEPTTRAKVRITAMDYYNRIGVDISDNNFTIAALPKAQITDPNTSEVIPGGEIYTIRWKSNDTNIAYFDLYYSLNSLLGPWTRIAAYLPGWMRSYNWSVPAVDTSRARLRLDIINNLGITGTDYGNGDFIIDSTPPIIFVISPNGGEQLTGGSYFTITYQSLDANFGPYNTNISYSLTGRDGPWYRIATQVNNTGSYRWKVPYRNSNDVYINISVFDRAGHTSYNQSATNFSIISGPELLITYPNGGEIFPGGATITILWNKDLAYSAVPRSINISYQVTLTINQTTYTVTNSIAVNTENTGSYLWTIPKTITVSVPIIGPITIPFDSRHVKIIMTSYDVEQRHSQDDSDEEFTVDSSAPSINVEYPNGGEVLKGGENITIRWSATDITFENNSVKIEYSIQGIIGPWIPLTTNASLGVVSTVNFDFVTYSGTFVWKVPLLNSTLVRVRVTVRDLAKHSATDISNGDVIIDNSIIPITLITPNGGETIGGGSKYKILWIHDEPNKGENSTNILFSPDGGETWNIVATGVNDSGEYIWDVPYMDVDGGRIKLIIYDAAGHESNVTSSNNFSIDSVSPTFGGLKDAKDALTGGRITLSWTPAVDDKSGISGYNIYITTSPSNYEGSNKTFVPGNVTSYSVNGLYNGVKYYFMVHAVDGAGNEDTNTVEMSAIPTDKTPPVFEGLKTIEDMNTGFEVKLMWDNATDANTDPVGPRITYLIYQSEFKFENIPPESTYNTTNNSFIVKNLTPNKEYYFMVLAKDWYGNINKTTLDVKSVIPRDRISPLIEHNVTERVPANTDLPFEANVTDNVNVSGVYLYYRTIGELTYKNISLNKIDNFTYRILLNGSEVIPPGLQYYIEARDVSNNIATRPAKNASSNPYIIEVYHVYGSIEGIVKDIDSGQPVKDAIVTIYIAGTNTMVINVTTEPDGKYRITGRYDIKISKKDYKEITRTDKELKAGETLTINFNLVKIPHIEKEDLIKTLRENSWVLFLLVNLIAVIAIIYYVRKYTKRKGKGETVKGKR